MHLWAYTLISVRWTCRNKPEAEIMNGQFCWGFWFLTVLRLEVSVYNVYITHQFQITLLKAEEGLKFVSSGDCDCTLSQLRLRIRPQRQILYCSQALHFKRKVTKIVSPSTVQAYLFLQKVQKVWKVQKNFDLFFLLKNISLATKFVNIIGYFVSSLNSPFEEGDQRKFINWKKTKLL
jgi:hypothetical protein